MKPLTIEELKALEVGDWVWVVDLGDGSAKYIKISMCCNDSFIYDYGRGEYVMSRYGDCWLAYKNKEQAEAKGEIVQLKCKASCVAVEAYKVKSDCGFCDFDIGGDHFPYCEFEDNRNEYHGKKICKYDVESRFIPIDKLDGTECLDKEKAEQECDKLNYDHACAVRAYCGSSMYLDDMGDLVKSITKAEAKRRLAEIKGEKKLKEKRN